MREAIALGVVGLLAACGQWPRDAEETLQRAKRGEPLAVGYSIAEPWVGAGGGAEGPTGIEPDLVRAWARENGIRLTWTEGAEGQLVEALGQGSVDLLVAGLRHNTAHAASIGATQPYYTAEVVIGAAPGAPIPESWEKVPVQYDAGRPQFAALIARAKATPQPAAGPRPARYWAAYRDELQALGLRETGKRLGSEKRVMAARPAENALALSLDRFLHARKHEIGHRLVAEARR